MSRTRPRGDADASSPATPTTAERQPPVIRDRVKPSKKFAEAAGGTAAGCAAVCCCCPCGLVNLLVFTVVRLPAGLCKKALRKQRMKRKIAAGLSKKKHGILVGRVSGEDGPTSPAEAAPPPAAAEAAEMEMEGKMWAEFDSTGFWRSSSQREDRIFRVPVVGTISQFVKDMRELVSRTLYLLFQTGAFGVVAFNVLGVFGPIIHASFITGVPDRWSRRCLCPSVTVCNCESVTEV